jgi:hypothetical protein
MATTMVALEPSFGLSRALLAPHTSGPRDVPQCGALSLLEKTPHYRGVGELLLG